MNDKIIEIEGKKYIEFDVNKQIKYNKIKDVVMLLLIASAVIALVMAIITLIDNRDIINKDALIIGMEKHGFVSCQCIDEEGLEWNSLETGFISQPQHNPNSIFADLDLENLEVVS